MKTSLILLLVVTTGLLVVSQATSEPRCTLSDKKLKKNINSFYQKCLKKGFETFLPGCEPQGDPDKLKKRQMKKCNKLQTSIARCDAGCPVDGGWSEYGEWSSCSAECEGGELQRDRECNNPAPSHGGADCEGASSQTQPCNEQPCATTYTLVHNTGVGKYYATNGEFLFTLIGSEGETSAHKCLANRAEGASDECSFKDEKNIGKLKELKIENKSADMWVFVSMAVKVNDVLRAKWRGSKQVVDDYKTETISFTYIGDETVQYKITHQTRGTSKYDGGQTTGAYLFSIIGKEGTTSAHDCPADRGLGVTAGCTFEDNAEIGDITDIRIKNKSTDQWIFNWIKVNDLAAGSGTVADLSTIKRPLS